MKVKNRNTKTPASIPTEIGYAVDVFRNMIEDAKASGYSKVTSEEIKAQARKRQEQLQK